MICIFLLAAIFPREHTTYIDKGRDWTRQEGTNQKVDGLVFCSINHLESTLGVFVISFDFVSFWLGLGKVLKQCFLVSRKEFKVIVSTTQRTYCRKMSIN